MGNEVQTMVGKMSGDIAGCTLCGQDVVATQTTPTIDTMSRGADMTSAARGEGSSAVQTIPGGNTNGKGNGR